MTSNGEEDKVEQAKKILKNGVIGLAIILASWGIASFVISRLIGATNGGNGSGCTDGQSLSCGCGGSMSCIDGAWGVCFGSNCHGGGGPVSCDSDPLPGCQAASQICAEDSYCDSGTCTCVAKGELGDSCDADTETPVCEADNSLCAEYLTCSTDTCTCVGAPVITEVSPAGGFCNENQNKSCQNDSDCSSGCNLLTPNGAVDNIITILGANFGNYDPANSKVVFGGNAVGVSPATINSDCVNSWTNNQIIVAVPAGAVTGAVKVIAADNQSDVTNDDRGPMIPDFNVNNIIRPGLCLLTPDSGALSQQLGYRGINLYGAEAYFGKYSKNVPALDSMFNNPAGIIGTGTIPNVDKGRMSSFVVAQIGDSQERSNYVSFTKQADLEAGPFISYFEPTTGRAGQYITIHGGGFGGARGFSKVYFGTTEASYEFTAVCANSVWRDKQIIVKVPANLPDGSHEIKIKLDDKEIDSKNANPNVFLANANASLKTSICKISPTRGQIDTRVSLWGEYFGDNGSQAVTEFTYQRATSSQIDINQGANRVMPLVPVGAVTGPVKVIKNNEFGNDINFEIGTCTEDADCGTEICCPADTYKQGRCASALAECYLQIPSSVFEWNFSTGFGNVTSTVEYDSCQGMAQSLGACQVGSFCPNSPGLCSPYVGKSKVLGACDASCATVGACAGNSCTYNAAKDRCVLNNAVCDLSANFSYTLGNESFETIKTCQQFSQFNNQKHWQIKVSTSCPTGWTRLAGNVCVDSVSNSNSTCSVCATGLNCQDINQTNVGSCVTSELCVGTASCAGTQCLAAEASRCDCCCTIGEDARDCCAPLTCTGTCGSDVIEGDGGLGQCSGCAIKTNGVFDVAASDQACNCSNHSGKYCDTSVPTGACVDCSSLTTKESCLAHSQSCCFDSRGTSSELDDVCRGGDGKAVSADPANPSFGYCAYFDCQSASSTPAGNPALCASSTPKTFGLFKTIDACTDGCTSSPGLSFCGQHDGDLLGCSAAAGCCFNFSNQKCNSGQQINGGYCAYYNCQAAPNQNQCNPVPNNTGVFSNLSDCTNACAVTPLGNLGKDCRNLNSTSTTSCNQSFCSSPFACLNGEGAAGLPGDCGTCCCQVGDPNSCAGIGSGNLVCQPNQAPCSGEDRGLCCGCSQDLDCGNADTLGCDSGTCCRARPEILNNLLKPAHGAEGVCRNTVLQIPFDQAIDYESLSGNILLLEERLYSWQTCPAGTFIAENGDINNLSRPSWLARTYDRLIFSLSSGLRHLGWSQAALAIGPPSSEKIYCAVPGEASLSQSGEGSVIEFAPS